MSAAFTPGPWHIFASGYAAEKHHAVEVNDASGLTVAFSLKFVPEYAAQSDANAHLIAAAPDLYEAAEAVENWIKDLGGFAEDGTQPAAVFQRLSAALAKARGETL